MSRDRHAGPREPGKDNRHGEFARFERAQLLANIDSARSPLVPFVPGSRVGHVVDPDSGCWLWTGAIAKNGYAVAGIPGTARARVAHRQYYEREKGPVPAGLDLDHTCRRRYCVNPDHLDPVSRSENTRRAPTTLLNATKVRYIRHVFETFEATSELVASVAIAIGVKSGTVLDVVHRRTWADT